MDDDRTNAATLTDWTITVSESITAIDAAAWNRCAGIDNPLQSHALLAAMEDSGSAVMETGWTPQHLSLKDPTGRTAGVMPFYIKTHSYGEYVFDHAWANAWTRAGGHYYPKGQSAIPFTPVPGQRLMIAPDAPIEAQLTLAEGMIKAGAAMELSSLHITFLGSNEAELLEASGRGWINRRGMQFHWHNQDYSSFDDFLETMTSRKRKTIRRERRSLHDSGVTFRHLSGDSLTPETWDKFYDFYLSTVDKKWGGAYLNRGFFEAIHASMAEKVLLIMAEKDGETIAGALNFIGTDTLYGRNWGSRVELPFLHFETCYYQAIDAAIERGLKRVEAGAQGLHKVQRGYEPVTTWSSHYLYHEGFADAIRHYTAQESAQLDREIEELRGWMPYRKGEG
jgi:predicted N-acyltransferase